MAVRREIPDHDGHYAMTTRPESTPEQIRSGIFELGHTLGMASRAALPADAAALGAVILRGGLLLYPGFARVSPELDFCLLAMERDGDGRAGCRYLTPPPRREYDTAILIDCVAATGGTLLASRRVLSANCSIPAFQAAVLCSSESATRTLLDQGIDVVGFRLDEALNGDVVTPDLGELDAGDLFSGIPAMLRRTAE